MWYKSDVVITPGGYESFEDYNEANVERAEKELKKSLDKKYW